MSRKSFTQGTRVVFRTKESRIRPLADPVVEWEGTIGPSPEPGFVCISYQRRDGSSGGHTIGLDEIVGVAPDQRKWEKRTLDVHDAAAKHYRENPPPKKLKREPDDKKKAD